MNGTMTNTNNNVFLNGISTPGTLIENDNITVGEGTFGLAPGAERSQHSSISSTQFSNTSNVLNHNEENAMSTSAIKGQFIPPIKLVMDYSTDFPKLPETQITSVPVSTNVWNRRAAIKSTDVTDVFKLSVQERASRGLQRFGSSSEEQHKCNNVAVATGTKIELCEAKDQSLTILISGKRPNVDEARSRLVRELQTQATIKVTIPKEYHGHIIGKDGSRLHNLENEFLCKVFIPNRDEKSDVIRISGPSEFIESAARKIREIGDEIARQGNESIQISREFFPWIRGPFNENLERFTQQYPSVKIKFPPLNSKNETINVTGDRSEVDLVAAEIKAIYAKKKQTNKMLTCKVAKPQHRFIIGSKRSGIEEILRETDVAVEVPAEEEESDSIILRGPSERLGDALALVYSRASSVISQEINYPEWMRRFLIGPKGSTLQQLVPKQDKLRLEFEDGGIIYLEGSPEAVKTAHSTLNAKIQQLNNDLASEIIKVPVNFHRHIIGRNGAQVNRLKEENDVQIIFLNDNANSEEIRVEGKKEGVKNAIATIKGIVKKLEDEKSRDIIIEHRFHGQVIGKNGDNVQKWRQQFPSVAISFPDATNKLDIVNLRGDRKEVDELFKAMTKMVKDLVESNYQDTVFIYKQYYKHIVGKNGANISKIREETQTRIELPTQGDGKVTVTGKQANVEKAIKKLNKIQNELASVVTNEVTIPSNIHNRLLSNGRRLIRDIEEEFGGVHIMFPREKGSHKVTICGPKDDVLAAEKALISVAKHCEETTEELIVETKPEYIKFLIGRDGINVKKLREKYPTVRIVFPNEDSTDKINNILLLGKKEEVEAVKTIYEKQISDLNETVEICMIVDPKYHRHFIQRSAEVLKEIQSQNGGCQISFPRLETGDSKVIIKGSKSCIEAAKARIEEIVEDLEAQITINVDVPEIHHRSLYKHLNDIRNQFNVQIRIPDRNNKNEEIDYVDGIAPGNLIQITGREEKCELAKQTLLALIPVTRTINVPLDFHRSLIGTKGETISNLMTTYAVRIKIPPKDEKSEEISVTGTVENVDLVIKDIEARVVELERQAEERRLRSFKVCLDIPIKYHQRLIGPRGSKVRDMSERHKVQIKIPNADANSTIVTITGYEANCYACKEEIELEDFPEEINTTQEVEITGAPWQIDNMEQFPAMNGASNNDVNAHQKAPVPAGVWSQRRW